jgi:deoxyribodipyrimidine photolyase-related protein
MKIVLVFPVHLFKNNDLLNTSDKKYILEDPVYFSKYNTHKLKLILHRASMKNYAKENNLTYIDYNKVHIIKSLNYN